MIQLHGDETPERVQEIKNQFSVPVMKVIPISVAEDLERAKVYEDAVDWLMFDAKGESLPGGNGCLLYTSDAADE